MILVTGAGGGLGSNVVRAAVARGVKVRALVRNPAKARLPEGVELVQGDATDVQALTRALEGCDALFHLVNVVIGKDWVRATAQLLDAAIAACRTTGARLVFPANVWVFGRGVPSQLVSEQAAFAPCSTLGEARQRKEEKIRASGIRWVMIRLPEFYGPHVQTLTGPPLQKIAAGGKARWWGPADVPIELVYMPDAAQILLEVGLAADVDGHVFHLPGVAHTTARKFLQSAIRISGGGDLAVMPTFMVKAAAYVNPLARAFVDILHLWEEPILLDGSKLRARFPELAGRMTSYDDGIAATVAWLRANPGANMYG
jgi:nucleoside-diphosphate-sugar epimerase